ncbi:MAG TPA: hypothetical protein VF307_05560, partial [Candidatus Nanopelagicaceae bacterium]
DPLVADWDGLQPVDSSWDCHVAVVATAQPGLPVAEILSRGVPVLDCTGTYRNHVDVIRL